MRCYLDQSPARATHWTFDEVAEGAMDAEVRNLFTDDAIEKVKALARERINNIR